MNKSLSIVVPVYNEAEILPKLFKELREVVDFLELSCEVVFVDDGSTDASWEEIKSTVLEGVRIRALRFTRNFGKEAAIYAGLKVAMGDAVIVMDADLQHPPSLIPEMVSIWRDKGVPIVEAVKRRRQKEDFKRRVGANLFYELFAKTSGIDIRSATDFKLLDRTVVSLYLSLPEKIRFFRGLTAWTGFPSKQISFVPSQRPDGVEGSKWSFKRLISFASSSIISFSSAPLRIVTYLGIFTFVGSFVLGIQTILVKLRGDAVPGFATVILIQLILGSILMIALGLIGEYLARIYEEMKSRPLYVVEEFLGDNIKKDTDNTSILAGPVV